MKSKMTFYEKLGLIICLLLFIIVCISIFITSIESVKNIPADKFLPEVIIYE